jgi:hypothetical protein
VDADPVEIVVLALAQPEHDLDRHPLAVQCGDALLDPVVEHPHPPVGLGARARQDLPAGQLDDESFGDAGRPVLAHAADAASSAPSTGGTS